MFVHRISVCAKYPPWLPLSRVERMEMNLTAPFSHLDYSEPGDHSHFHQDDYG